MPNLVCPIVVGRVLETQTLSAALAAAVAGAGGMVCLTGEAGVGKSRLARELAAEARHSDITVLVGRAVAAGEATPFRPLSEALAQLLRHRPLPDDPGLGPWLPALASVLPIGSQQTGPHGDGSAVARGEAILRLLELRARPALLLILEDLHWADPDTLTLVEYLGDNLAESHVLCVTTVRSEPRTPAAELIDRLGWRGVAKALPLGRLQRADVEAMVRACAPAAATGVVDRVAAVSEGMPFLVEELLGSPGLPASFVDAVRVRLAEIGPAASAVLLAAAVLGRDFDWRLLAATCGVPASDVETALEAAVRSMLVTVDGERFQFRHALTREAVLATVLPTRRAAIAATALRAVEHTHPRTPAWADLAADLAAQAGERHRAGQLLLASGRAAFDRGAVATAAETLWRAWDELDGHEERAEVGPLLIEALALAGRIDDAVTRADTVLRSLPETVDHEERRAEVHLMVAQAAVAAGRWQLATSRLDEAERLNQRASPRAAVLRADVAINQGDKETARNAAEMALATPGCPLEVRCNALELIGRTDRSSDLDAARASFEEALRFATDAGLPVWRMRALHELGTVEMFHHAGTGRLKEAQKAAEQLGALSTGAVLHMHLAAALMFSFEIDEAHSHAQTAEAMSGRLGLDRVHALALMFLAEIHAMRLERVEMERYLSLAKAAAPDDPEVEGSGWAGSRGMLALLQGDRDEAIHPMGRGVALLRAVPLSGPACYRGLYPLLLAVAGDRHAATAIGDARLTGMEINSANRGMLRYAEAVLAGRRGDRTRAEEMVARAETDVSAYRGWSDLARMSAAEAALADGWGHPEAWLAQAGASFTALGFGALAERCAALMGAGGPSRLDGWGVTQRERDVLALVAEGLANKEIAVQLRLSPRTVEKHVESLLRKTGTRSRTQLVALIQPPGGQGH